MKVKKIGHCCLLLEVDDVTILTDPGTFSSEQNTVTGVDVVLITHEHADHLHIESLKKIIENNPNAQVFTNSSVSIKLDEAGIRYSLLENDSTMKINGVSFEAVEAKHAEIFEDFGQVRNVGYYIANRFFYPGDSFYLPEKMLKRKVEILALPVAGPWCKVLDVVRYALLLQPRVAFPVHDGMLQKEKIGSFHAVPERVLSEHGITFLPMNDGDEREL